jgi:hypothetical protein
VQGIGRGLAQGAGEQDGTGVLAGEINESGQAAGETGDGTGRINDEQAGVEGADEGGQVVQALSPTLLR